MLKKQIDNGVIIGRFQVDTLHEGHKALLDSVADSVGRLIIFVGLSPNKCTKNNPLDFMSVRSMLQEHYPDAVIQYIKDTQSNKQWSEVLDSQIEALIGPRQNVMLFGSRDSFIPYYSGKYPVEELVQQSFASGSQIRRDLAARSRNSRDWRAGVIWAMQNQWDGPEVCIDSALFNDDFTRILLGRKKDETLFRLIGGFVENKETFETAVARESMEEANVVVKNTKYVGSFFIDDWRKRGEVDKITTALYYSTFEGKPTPGDDIYELRWFDFEYGIEEFVVLNHKEMIIALLKHLDNE